MPSYVEQLTRKQLIRGIPSHIPESIQYEVIMGSFAYGVSSDTSDMDIYGFSIPDKDLIFPHLAGEIEGFGKRGQRFETWTQHHIKDPSALGGEGREYDFAIHSIVKYFDLCMANNPNMIDSLFVPVRCITFSTPIGQRVRESRHLFLHRGCWQKFKGYAYSQLHKMEIKKPEPGSKRWELVEKFGFDTKFAYHVPRLMLEVEQILTEGTLDLERPREYLKAIRRGEVSLEQITELFKQKEIALEELYNKSTLPWGPRVEEIKTLLLECLEQHFGSIKNCIQTLDPATKALRDIQRILYEYHQNPEVQNNLIKEVSRAEAQLDQACPAAGADS